MAELVPENPGENLSLGWAQCLQGGVHPRLQDGEAFSRVGRLSQLRHEAFVQPDPPHGRTTVVGNHSTGHAEEPEPIFRRGRNHLDAAPGHKKHLGNDVFDVVPTDPPVDIGTDGRPVSVVKHLEPCPAFLGITEPDHGANVHSSSLTQITWPGQARIRRPCAALGCTRELSVY